MFNITSPDFSNKEVELAYASTILTDSITANDKTAEALNSVFLELVGELNVEHTIEDLESARAGFVAYAEGK